MNPNDPESEENKNMISASSIMEQLQVLLVENFDVMMS